MAAKVFHVVPRNDLKPHSEDERVPCWCAPVKRKEGRHFVWVHNSMDGRELVEHHGVN